MPDPQPDPAPGPSNAADETADYVAIVRLQRAYADVVNRRAWDELPRIFAPEATVDLDLVTRPSVHLQGPVDIGRFIGPAMERFGFFEFVVLNTHVELWPDGDRSAAVARVYMCELRQPVGQLQRDDAFGLYRDRYVRTAEGWRIAARRYRSLGRFPSGDTFPISAADRTI